MEPSASAIASARRAAPSSSTRVRTQSQIHGHDDNGRSARGVESRALRVLTGRDGVVEGDGSRVHQSVAAVHAHRRAVDVTGPGTEEPDDDLGHLEGEGRAVRVAPDD